MDFEDDLPAEFVTPDVKDGGRPIANVFTAILGFSPWPNDRVRAAFVDLNLIRQLIVHYGGRVLGDAYYAQLTTKGLLGVRQDKNAPPIRFIEHIEALKHIQVVVQCAIEQNRHLRDEMLQRPEWVQ